jgi:hypothetical protein
MIVRAATVLFVCVTLCGCFHELQPHRLQRLNRGPDLTSGGYNFSVPDPIDDDEPARRAPME